MLPSALPVRVAEVDGQVTGVVRVAPGHGTLVLRGMRIVEEWRRRGVGSRMLRAVAEWE
jgi:GNAT superfamily N-acetyltransferase